MPAEEPYGGYRDVSAVKSLAGHYNAVNLSHLGDEFEPSDASSRVEVRLFDSTIEPGRVQANVNLALLLTAAAQRGDEPDLPRITAGETRRRFGARRLSGEEWEEATRPFRRLVALMRKHDMATPENLQQVFHLFAESRWPTA